MIVGGKRNHILDRDIRDERRGPFIALVIPPADHVPGNHQLISTHRLVRILL